MKRNINTGSRCDPGVIRADDLGCCTITGNSSSTHPTSKAVGQEAESSETLSPSAENAIRFCTALDERFLRNFTTLIWSK